MSCNGLNINIGFEEYKTANVYRIYVESYVRLNDIFNTAYFIRNTFNFTELFLTVTRLFKNDNCNVYLSQTMKLL